MRSARRLACPVRRALGRSGGTNDTVKATAGARVGAHLFAARKVRAAKIQSLSPGVGQAPGSCETPRMRGGRASHADRF
jgi:hypothetical protein